MVHAMPLSTSRRRRCQHHTLVTQCASRHAVGLQLATLHHPLVASRRELDAQTVEAPRRVLGHRHVHGRPAQVGQQPPHADTQLLVTHTHDVPTPVNGPAMLLRRSLGCTHGFGRRAAPGVGPGSGSRGASVLSGSERAALGSHFVPNALSSMVQSNTSTCRLVVYPLCSHPLPLHPPFSVPHARGPQSCVQRPVQRQRRRVCGSEPEQRCQALQHLRLECHQAHRDAGHSMDCHLHRRVP